MEGFVLHILKLNILAAVVVLSVRLLCVFLKNKLTARWKYLVWLVLSVTLLFPVRLPEELSLFRMPVRLPAKELSLSPPPISETTPGQELTQGTDSTWNTPSGHTAPTVTQAEFVDHTARTAASSDRRSKTAASSLFLILWLSVALVVILFEGFSYFFSMKKLRRMSIPAHNRQTREIYTSVCRTKHIACPPALNQNAGLSTPLLAGLWKTQLYLPSVGYSPEELRLIFHHELSHYLHRDLWYKMLLRVCATIYWFNL